jgi:hypothetical protein
MDEIVNQAILKWPDVPYCYGWLGLDARGSWRMRDERTQALGLPGDKIFHPALLGFIARNYTCDEHGSWYFQNGPQRVYVNLAATPFIARTEPVQGFVLHTAEPLSMLDEAWITASAQLIIKKNEKVAQVDDRDMIEYLSILKLDAHPVSDLRLLAWLDNAESPGRLTLSMGKQQIPVQRLAEENIAAHFGFNAEPQKIIGDTQQR